MNRKKQITIIGPIASGKSTVSRILAKHFMYSIVDADLYEENPFLPNYAKDTSRWSFATELYFTIQRIKKLRTMGRLLRISSVIVDAGLIMTKHVYAKNHLVQGTMTAAEWDFYCKIVDDYGNKIPKPEIIVALKASPKTQLERISKRGRDFEKEYGLEYLQQITDRLNEFIEKLRDEEEQSLIVVDTEKVNVLNRSGSREVIDKVRRAIEKFNT